MGRKRLGRRIDADVLLAKAGHALARVTLAVFANVRAGQIIIGLDASTVAARTNDLNASAHGRVSDNEFC